MHHRPAAAFQPLCLLRLRDRVDVVRNRQECHRHRSLGLTVELRHDGTEDIQGLAQLRRRHWRGSIDQVLQRGIIEFADARMRQNHIDQGRRQQSRADAISLDAFHNRERVRPLHHEDAAAPPQDGVADAASGMRHWRRAEIARRLAVGHVRRNIGNHRLQRQAALDDAARCTRGAAGAGYPHDRKIVGTGRDDSVGMRRAPFQQ